MKLQKKRLWRLFISDMHVKNSSYAQNFRRGFQIHFRNRQIISFSFGYEPWKFIVVQNKELRENYNRIHGALVGNLQQLVILLLFFQETLKICIMMQSILNI